MSLILNLGDVSQSTDNSTFRFTDTTGDYSVSNTGGWGAPNPTVASLIAGDLTIKFTITTSDEVTTEYTVLDVLNLIDPDPTTSSELVFDINPSHINLGSADSEFPDGWYKVEYTIADDGSGQPYTHEESFFVDGVVRNRIYTKLINIPDVYHFEKSKFFYKNWEDIYEPIYLKSLFDGALRDIDISTKSRTLKVWNTLERLTE